MESSGDKDDFISGLLQNCRFGDACFDSVGGEGFFFVKSGAATFSVRTAKSKQIYR